ncbi:MAG: tryptophan-rich sensory protein [Ruminococcaceae bacterium]|nr:tryptophan-rich sensory protein [Oscillospiraceae bacterium]
MTIRLKPLLINLFIPLAVGGLSALFTMNSMENFERLNQPPLSPPGWLFPVVWTILYTLMGIAAYLVVTSNATQKDKRTALTIYGVQLFFNFLWSIIFFNREDFLFAFIWLVALWALIIANIILFYRISKPAGIMLIPYLLWVTFAGYLNFAIYLLN